MKKIDRYIIKKYFSSFTLAIGLLIVVVVIFDFSEKIERFSDSNAPSKEIIFDYYFNFVPYFFNLFLYLFVFIAVVFFTSKLAQNSEFIAMLSSGISFYRLLLPYILCAVTLMFLSFFMSNFFIPKTNIKLTDFENKYLRQSAKYSKYVYDIHVQTDDNTYAYVKNFNGKINEGTDFTLEVFDFNSGMKEKITSRMIKWNEIDSSWILSNYISRKIYENKEYIKQGDSLKTKINLHPNDLVFVVNDLKTMNFWQLNKFIKEEKIKGIRNIVEYEVEKNTRISDCFATIILTVLGFSLSNRKKKSGMGINLGFGMTIAFSYILMMQISKVFATNSGLNPTVAAWIPNIIFALIAITILYKVPK